MNWENINRLIDYVRLHDGIADKARLSKIVQEEFSLVKDRSVFYCEDFAIRFSKSERKVMSNTVLSLSALQKYDNVPFIVCVVSSNENFMMLANATFLKKISHSSQELRIDNIKGSFNGGDIMQSINDLDNIPSNFRELFGYHTEFTFDENLIRLVEATNGIVGRVMRYDVNDTNKEYILSSGVRLAEFIKSNDFFDLKDDLDSRVARVQGEIAIAAFIDNVNLRGRVIEYLITDDGSTLKEQIVHALNNHDPLPHFTTNDKLGDYSKIYPDYHTETDIKTKIMFLGSNPKAYNIDKLLSFLSENNSIYMLYLIGIDENANIVCKLVPAFDTRILNATHVIHHWAGRNSRGVAQFDGHVLGDIISSDCKLQLDQDRIREYLVNLISL